MLFKNKRIVFALICLTILLVACSSPDLQGADSTEEPAVEATLDATEEALVNDMLALESQIGPEKPDLEGYQEIFVTQDMVDYGMHWPITGSGIADWEGMVGLKLMPTVVNEVWEACFLYVDYKDEQTERCEAKHIPGNFKFTLNSAVYVFDVELWGEYLYYSFSVE